MGIPGVLTKWLEGLEDLGKVQSGEQTITYYDLQISHSRVISAVVHEDPDEFGVFNLEASLGPRNMKRVIDFLMMLPPEPEVDADGVPVFVQETNGLWFGFKGEPDEAVLAAGPFSSKDLADEWVDKQAGISRT